MMDVAEKLRTTVYQEHSRVVELFSKELHPTASSILDTGLEVITSGGGGALTMRAVAKRANLKLASLQYYFQTFDDLVSALFYREFGMIAGIIWGVFEELESRAQSPAAALRKAAQSFMPPENFQDAPRQKMYFHLMAFCSYNEDAFLKAKVFYSFYNTLIAYLISRVNPSLGNKECMARAVMITSALEGTGVYTILGAAGHWGEAAVRREVGDMAVTYAELPSSAGKST